MQVELTVLLIDGPLCSELLLYTTASPLVHGGVWGGWWYPSEFDNGSYLEMTQPLHHRAGCPIAPCVLKKPLKPFKS